MKWTLKLTGLVGLLGVFAGVTSSLLGIGAGVVVVPVLSLWWDKLFDDPQQMAQGTALALMVPMSTAGCLRYYINADPTEWRIAVPVALWALLVAAIGLGFPLWVTKLIGFTEVLGNVSWETVAIMSVTAVIGVVWIGAPLANVLPTDTLRKMFGVLVIITGIRMLGLHTVVYNLFAGGSGS